MSERNAVQRAFDQFGKEAGFEKKSGSWYARHDEVIAILNLQKSQYGPRYFFNQGFWLRQLDDERYPKPNHAHVIARLEDIFPGNEQRINQLLDLEYSILDERRFEELVVFLRERLLPLIKRGFSIAGLRSMVNDGTLAGAGFRGPAQEALGICGNRGRDSVA